MAFLIAWTLISFYSKGEHSSTVARPIRGLEVTPVSIVALDEAGVVVVGGKTPIMRGYTLDGRLIWTDRSAAVLGQNVVCNPQCPAVVFSGSSDSLTSSVVPDPEPRTKGGGEIPPVLAQHSYKRNLLAVHAGSVVTLLSERAGSPRLTVSNANEKAITLDVKSSAVFWKPSSSGDSALAQVLEGRGQSVAILLKRQRSRWTTSEIFPSHGLFGCVSQDGSAVIHDSPRGTVLSHAGTPDVLLKMAAMGGDCAFSSQGAVVASFSLQDGAANSKMTIVDLGGTVAWSHTIPYEVRLRASPTQEHYVLVYGGLAKVLNGVGRPLREITSVADASYLPDGRIVVVSPDLKLRILPG